MSTSSPSSNTAGPASESEILPRENAGPSGTAGHSDRPLEMVSPRRLHADKRNARTHSKQQIEQIARSIERFGFLGAVLVDDDNRIIAGHGRVQAAKRLGLDQVPVLRVNHLSGAERRAFGIADNRLAELAAWDTDVLAIELQDLIELNFDIALTGFEIEKVDSKAADMGQVEKVARRNTTRAKKAAAASRNGPVSRAGDLWLLGPHPLRCGESDETETYACLDAAIERWQHLASKAAILAGAGKTFAEIKSERASTTVLGQACGEAAAKQEAA